MNEKNIISVGDFEGPLDLLLALIAKQKIDIYDVSIAEIAEAYLAVMRTWQKMNMDVASDFVVMASRLLEIKSFKLLPAPAREKREDPETALVRQLADYQAFKAAGLYLEDRFKQNGGAVYRDPEPIPQPSTRPVHVDARDLAAHYEKLMRRYTADTTFRDTPPTQAPPSPYTLSGQREKIEQVLKKQHAIYFSCLIADHKREEVVASFLAALDLAKENRVTLEQTANFGEIALREPKR